MRNPEFCSNMIHQCFKLLFSYENQSILLYKHFQNCNTGIERENRSNEKVSPFFMHQSLKSKRKSVLISLSLSSRFFEQLIISSIHFHERPLAIALSTYFEKIRPPGGGLGWGKAKFQLFFKSIFTQPVNGRFFTTYLK